MLKKILYISILSSLSVSGLNASVYKGHALYQKKCLKCHDKALEFVIAKDTDEWDEVMRDKGVHLQLIHLKSSEAKPSWKYFKGKRYPKNVKHYRDFLFEYAADTGNIPACD